MEREPFIRATEVWVPAPDRQTVVLQSGIYGEMDYFATVSRGMEFKYGEGLPGKVWETGRPIILNDLHNSYFQRSEAARTEGLSCAVAMPIFRDGALSCITLLFCGDDRFRIGALELWGLKQGSEELVLVDGYFGAAHEFEAATRSMGFARGRGIPGRVWSSGEPEVMASLDVGGRFVRYEAADKVGFDRAIGLPCCSIDGAPWVLALVSSQTSPVVGRFEHWVLDKEAGGFRFVAGYCEETVDLTQVYAGALIPEEIGPFGRACRKGVSLVDEDLATDGETITAVSAVEAGLKSMVVLPLCSSTGFKAVVAWYF